MALCGFGSFKNELLRNIVQENMQSKSFTNVICIIFYTAITVDFISEGELCIIPLNYDQSSIYFFIHTFH